MTTQKSLRVAVIGAGMAGRAHAAAYRAAATVFGSDLPPVELVAIGDVNAEAGSAAAARFGFARSETDWRAIAEADDIDVVSVVVANHLHREIVDGLLAAGKHVLCEKPLSDSIAGAEAMAESSASAEESGQVARIGFTMRRAPAINAIRDLITDATLGRVLHFNASYWTDYGLDPQAPMSWRYKGEPGTGALADLGSHLSDIAEFLCGPVQAVNGGGFSTAVTSRPKPLGAVVGHEHVEVSDERETVENDDYARFSAEFASGAGTLQLSRVAAGHPNTLRFEVFCENGAASWDMSRPAEFGLFEGNSRSAVSGEKRVIIGPEHPYVSGGLAMDAPGVAFGQNELFIYQARAFLEEVAGRTEAEGLPRCAVFGEGVHNMKLLDAVAQSAANDGSRVVVS